MKRTIICFIGIIAIYILISLFFLNGELTYWTSFNESTIPDSKKAKLFITDNLKIETKGDSLKNLNEKFEIWTNKRYEIKYYGIIFHWTFENPNWRYLNLKLKENIANNLYFISKLKVNNYERDYMKNFTGGYGPCCHRIPCEVGDTITIEFIEWKNNTVIGKMKTIIE
nr:hypothetical protein [uncultured Flavobacterium sp.]